MNLREHILSADDMPRKEIEISEWGCVIFIRGMNVSELQEFERDAKKFQSGNDIPPQFRERIAVRYVEDESGAQVFTKEDVAHLGKKGSKPLQRILDAFLEINGLSEEDLEDLEGN